MALVDALREGLIQVEQPFVAARGRFMTWREGVLEIIHASRSLFVRFIPYHYVLGHHSEEWLSTLRQNAVIIREDVTRPQNTRAQARRRIRLLDAPRRRPEELDGVILRLQIEGMEEQSQPLFYADGRWHATFEGVPARAHFRLAI